MDKYQIIKKIGDGTFGTVYKAWNRASTEYKTVAIKKLKQRYAQWEKCVGLPEVETLLKFHHPNIIKLLEVIKERDEVFLVFECMDRNVYQLMKDSDLELTQVRNIVLQTLQGLHYIHAKGLFHRDLKPENLLESQGTVKIADFGLAKRVSAPFPFTDYVSTRWYRAPEIIVGAEDYGPSVDIFALGCIFAELVTRAPLFPGRNEADQLQRELALLGTPAHADYPLFHRLADKHGFKVPKCAGQSLRHVLKCGSEAAVDLIERMVRFHPAERITAAEALQHEFFQVRLVAPAPAAPLGDSFRQPSHRRESNQKNSFVEHSNSESVSRSRTGQLKSDCSKSDMDDEEDPVDFYTRDARYKPGMNLIKLINEHFH